MRSILSQTLRRAMATSTASKGGNSGADIVLYTASTMNGWKPVIFLEEAKVPYEVHHIDFGKNEQKEPWFVQINPNGRIPAIVDRSNEDFRVFESGAVLWYLAEKYNKFIPQDPKMKSEVLQWIMFQVGGIGPMLGQAMYFQRIAEPKGNKQPFAIERYVNESRRLLEVVDSHLKQRRTKFLVGDEFTIADMAMYPWARSYYWAKVSVDGLDSLQAYLDRIDERPAVQKALTIPKPNPAFFGEGNVSKAVKENADKF